MPTKQERQGRAMFNKNNTLGNRLTLSRCVLFVRRYIKEQNGIAGTLPFELSHLQNLRSLLLEEGILTGTIPTELGEVGTLEYAVVVVVEDRCCHWGMCIFSRHLSLPISTGCRKMTN